MSVGEKPVVEGEIKKERLSLGLVNRKQITKRKVSITNFWGLGCIAIEKSESAFPYYKK